jgi:hypothetical protein
MRAYVYSRYAWQMVGGEEGGRRQPTFAEFAAYLLRVPAEQYDNHWLPYWLHCHLCRLEYDVIAKMETFAADMDFITGEYTVKKAGDGKTDNLFLQCI